MGNQPTYKMSSAEHEMLRDAAKEGGEVRSYVHSQLSKKYDLQPEHEISWKYVKGGRFENPYDKR